MTTANRRLRTLAGCCALSLAAVLPACGGGDGITPPPPPPPTPLSIAVTGRLERSSTVTLAVTKAGVAVSRPTFDAAHELIDRDLERRVASMAFGDSAAFRRTIPYDTQLKRAMELLHSAASQRELLAAATQSRPRSD